MNTDRPTPAPWRRALAALLLALTLLAGACGQQSAAQPTAAPATTAASQPTAAAPAAATAGPTSAPTAAPTATVGAGMFQNPVLRADFPDPFLLRVGATYYAYATNAAGKNVQVASSTDLTHWKQLPDAMPALPRWAKVGGSLVWAPEVIAIGERYNLYFTARDKASDKQCVGVASSDQPAGKFSDPGDKPLVCQADQGGTIDPSPFRDEDGALYLYFKNDGNCCNKPTYLYVQPMAADGLSLTGEPTQLVRNDQAWEGRVVEAPTMVKHAGSYYLFFSANNYAGVEYAVGYASCQAPTGPCQDAPENPILASRLGQRPLVIGPGHQTIVQLGDQTWIVYHAWNVTASGLRGSNRYMWMDRLDWPGDKPDVEGPTTDPQPAPAP